LLNEGPLLVMVARLRDAVAFGCEEGYTSLVYGGDCAVLLGCLAGARGVLGEIGLVSVDGHDDAYRLEDSPDGQAADSEIALALGLTGANAPRALRELLPLVRPEHLAMLGPRRANDRLQGGYPSLAETVGQELFYRSDLQLRDEGCGTAGRAAVARVSGLASGAPGRARPYWLHVDLDVLDSAAFPAQDFLAPGGLSRVELVELVDGVLAGRGCCGVSITVYNPALDPDRIVGRLVVEFIARLALRLK
jgi:arginase